MLQIRHDLHFFFVLTADGRNIIDSSSTLTNVISVKFDFFIVVNQHNVLYKIAVNKGSVMILRIN